MQTPPSSLQGAFEHCKGEHDIDKRLFLKPHVAAAAGKPLAQEELFRLAKLHAFGQDHWGIYIEWDYAYSIMPGVIECCIMRSAYCTRIREPEGLMIEGVKRMRLTRKEPQSQYLRID